VYTALDATACIPYLSGKVISYKDNNYIDGAVSDIGRVPLQEAIKDGCSDILVLWTDEDKQANYGLPLIDRYIQLRLTREYPLLAKNYWNGHKTHRETIRLLKRSQVKNASDYEIEVIRVKDKSKIPCSWETNPEKLIVGAKVGHEVLMEKFTKFYYLRDRIIPFGV